MRRWARRGAGGSSFVTFGLPYVVRGICGASARAKAALHCLIDAPQPLSVTGHEIWLMLLLDIDFYS